MSAQIIQLPPVNREQRHRGKQSANPLNAATRQAIILDALFGGK
jgi:hypothetical protein